MVASPTLTSSQRHAAAALLAIALRQAQINQSLPIPLASDEDASSLWIHESCCWIHESCWLLRPIFRLLEIDESAWTKLEEDDASKDRVEYMVAGRFVNVYSANDWILGVTFRASLLTHGLAGIQVVNLPGIQAVNVPGVENVDVTDFIEGHSSYLWTVGEILAQLDLDSHYPVS